MVAIQAIDELLDVDEEDNTGRHSIQFANYLRIILTCSDAVVMSLASQTLGRLVKKGGAIMSECVDFEVKRSLEWLEVFFFFFCFLLLFLFFFFCFLFSFFFLLFFI